MPRCKPSTLRRRGACRDTQTRFRDATVSVEEQYALLVADVPAEWAGFAGSALVVDGGSTPWINAGAVVLAGLLPNARHVTLGGQDHNVDPEVIAPVLIDYFTA